MPYSRRHLLASLALLSPALPAKGQTSLVKVEEPWARATAASARTGAAYMRVTSAMADAIVAASSPVAETVEPHRTVNEGGVMRMLPARDLALPAGNLVEFKPGGLHIMLIGLKAPLRQGDSFALTLRFRTAAPVTVQVKIGAPGASGPGHSH